MSAASHPARVPEISRFFGIVIQMHFRDHQPPHFHARYGRERAWIAIGSNAVLKGSMSPRALALVVEWAAIHRGELERNWLRARAHKPVEPIEPLG